MKLTLNNFEQLINEKIVKRGRNYFNNGYVTDVEETEEGEFEIIVQGSDTYSVNLTIAGEVVTDFYCDCPYDGGPLCKHIVAALFYLQEDNIETFSLPAKKTAKQTEGEIHQSTNRRAFGSFIP